MNIADGLPSAEAVLDLQVPQSPDGEVLFERRDTRVVVHAALRPGPVVVDTPAPLCFLDPVVGLDSPGGAARVRLAERDGSQVLLRQVDPGEPDPERIPLYDGDELTVMEALTHVSLHTSPLPGAPQDFLFSCRIVPVRSEPRRVLARTLRVGEPDTGQRVHVRPGDQLQVDFTAELDHIDSLETPTASGHVPLTPVLWTWLSIGEGHAPARTRYLLAAARRLDTANHLLMDMQDSRRQLDQDGLGGPLLRRHWFDLIGAVEMAVVALGRAVDMVRQARDSIACTVAVPAQVTSSWPALRAIRNAYEHIEDRALGQVRARPHPDALTIFDQHRLLSDGVLVYGTHELDVDQEVPRLLAEVRQFLKDAAADG